MRKVIIGFLLLIVFIGITAGAFGAGLMVGRFTVAARPTPAAPPVTSETPTETAQPPQSTSAPTPAAPDDTEFNYALLQEVLNLLEADFYGDLPDRSTLAYGAIRGMLNTLDDPYTSFIDPTVTAIINEDASGQFEGIGATVRAREDGYIEVVRPIAGQPAEAAGIRAGDLILTVDDQSIVGYGIWEAISLIRGAAGTEVTLEIARPGERDTFFVTITRARIEMPIVESEMLEGNVAYVHLTEFDATASERVERALQELLDQGAEAIIFDLRDNPGGYLSQAIQVSDLFLAEGLVAIERDSSGQEQKFYSYDSDLGEELPLVVLVNGGSASASEIVAGALQDRQRAALIGEMTLGKGSVQLPHNLSDGSQLRVTIARWYTPNDTSIHGDGLTPDIEVPHPADTPVTEDPQLERALEYIREGQ